MNYNRIKFIFSLNKIVAQRLRICKSSFGMFFRISGCGKTFLRGMSPTLLWGNVWA